MSPAAIDSACTDLWDPVAAARVMVSLSGVLAGFMFSAIVIIITVNRPDGSGEVAANYALRLQVIALLTTIVSASANINTAGERICLRARTEWILSAGLPWMAVALSSISLVWLMIAYGWNSPQIIRLWTGGAYFALFGRLAGALVSSNSYVADVLREDTFGFHLATWTCAILTAAVSLFMIARRRPQLDSPEWQRRIASCGMVAVGYTVLSFIIVDLIGSSSTRIWTTTSPRMTYVYGALTLAPALLMLPFGVRAIPDHSTIKSNAVPEKQEIGNSTTTPDGHDNVHAITNVKWRRAEGGPLKMTPRRHRC